MLRIRTELKQTMMSYQELFEKSRVWGRQKMVESETGWEDLVDRRNKLLEEMKMSRKLKSDWETEVAAVWVVTTGAEVAWVVVGGRRRHRVPYHIRAIDEHGSHGCNWTTTS